MGNGRGYRLAQERSSSSSTSSGSRDDSGGFCDAVGFRQPAPQIDGLAALAAERELRPVRHLLALHAPAANRAGRVDHRLLTRSGASFSCRFSCFPSPPGSSRRCWPASVASARGGRFARAVLLRLGGFLVRIAAIVRLVKAGTLEQNGRSRSEQPAQGRLMALGTDGQQIVLERLQVPRTRGCRSRNDIHTSAWMAP